MLGLLMGLTYAVPAAACHRFSRWYYPTPQDCSVAKVARVAMPVRLPRASGKFYLLYWLAMLTTSPTRDGSIPILPDLSAAWDRDDPGEGMQRQKAIRQLTEGEH